MSAIGPGDWVECVDATPRPGSDMHDMKLISAGALYCVADVWGELGLVLVGVRSRRPSGYWVDRFRPVYRPKADLIQSLKAPPLRVGEFA